MKDCTETVSKNSKPMGQGKCKICGTNESFFKKDPEDIYYDPERRFSGIKDLQRKSHKSIKEVKEFAEKQDVYTKFEPIRNKFERRRVILHGMGDQWQADLVKVNKNKGYKYLLTCIDIFSKYAWVIPLKNKAGKQITQAFLEIFKSKRIPKKIQTDQGLEFCNSKVLRLFEDKGIKLFSSYSELKVSVV